MDNQLIAYLFWGGISIACAVCFLEMFEDFAILIRADNDMY